MNTDENQKLTGVTAIGSEDAKAPQNNAPSRIELAEKIRKLETKDKLSISVAMLALIVSSLTFAVNAWTSWRDRTYKELAIQPELSMFRETKEKVWGITSSGIGPAVIERFTIRDDFGCIDSAKNGSISAEQDRFFKKMTTDIIKEAKSNIDGSLHYRFNVENSTYANKLSNKSIIPQGQTLKLYTVTIKTFFDPKDDIPSSVDGKNVNPESLQEFLPNLEEVMNNSFLRIVEAKSLKMKYCSMSGIYCSELRWGNNAHYCDE